MIDDQGRRFYALVIGAAAYLYFVVGFVRRTLPFLILRIVPSQGGEQLLGRPLGWFLLNGAVTVACAYPLALFVLAQDRARASRVMIAAIVPITLVSLAVSVLGGASFIHGILHITLSAVIPWAMVQGLQRREQDMLALAGADADAATDTEPSNTASDTNAGKYVTIVWLLLSQALFAAAWVAVMVLSDLLLGLDSGAANALEAVGAVTLLGLLGTIGWSWFERHRGRYLFASLISAGAFLVLPLAGYVAFRLYD